MKLLHSERPYLDLTTQAHHILANLSSAQADIKSALKSKLSKAFTEFQINRLASALNALSDAQLDQIKLARKDIRQHAETLIIYEYDGL